MYKRKKLMSDINVVPYIDVMLVLLVIFMITAPLLTQGVDVELPKISAEPLSATKQEPVILTVDAKGSFYLNIGDKPNKRISTEKLQATVKKVLVNKPDIPVIVKGDHKVDYGKVVIAMSLLQQAGASKVGLMTEPPPSK